MQAHSRSTARGALIAAFSGALALAGCDTGLGSDTVARVGDLELTVEELSDLLAPITELPNDPGVVSAAVDFWTDYALLAMAVNEEGVLESLDIGPIADLERTRQVILRLRTEVIQPDTAISDEELVQRLEEDRPSEEVRARHILLTVAPGSTEAQRDSVRQAASELRDRAMAGESFAALASEYSQDQGSAANGGDLGFFPRGTMVPPFEEAAFALQPGQISDLVLTDFGYHIIRLEERRAPEFDEIAAEYRAQLQGERTVAAESIYLADIEGAAGVELGDGAVTLTREIAEDPTASLGGRGSEVLTAYEGGEFTAEDFRTFLHSQPVEIWNQVSIAGDDQLEQVLRELTRDRLLLLEAERMGISITDEESAEIEEAVRGEYVMIADFLGIDSLFGGTSPVLDTVDVAVMDLMARLVGNEQDIIPLGPLGHALNARYEVRRNDDAVDRVVARIGELRDGGPAEREALPTPLPETPAEAPADDSIAQP